jgi:hypothetical protein
MTPRNDNKVIRIQSLTDVFNRKQTFKEFT